MKTNQKKEIQGIRNWRNYQMSKGEVNSGELLVVPDQAYSIEQIFDKFRRGISLNIERNDGGYYLDEDSDDFDNIDLRQIAKDPYDIDESAVINRLKAGTQEPQKMKVVEKENQIEDSTKVQETQLAT